MKDLSIVVPVKDEAKSILPLVDRLSAALASREESWELVFVDDGSADRTWLEIERAGAQDDKIKGVRLPRSFGQQRALMAGMQLASGKAVVTMDGDLQHPPEMVPRLLSAWRQGAKVVRTRRRYLHSPSRGKEMGSRLFYRLFSALSDLSLDEGSSDFSLLDRSVVDTLLKFHDSEPFLRGQVSWLGLPTETLEFEAPERLFGASKYSLKEMTRFAFSAIPGFSAKPLYLSLWAGVGMGMIALLEVVYVLSQYAAGNTVPGWASIMVLMSVLFSGLFALIGVQGIYLGAVLKAVQKRPVFIVEKTSNLPRVDSLEAEVES